MKSVLFTFILGMFLADSASHSLHIELSNLKEDYVGKNLYIGYWADDKEDFPNAEKVQIKDMLIIEDLDFLITKSLKENTYAISLYIDMNGNGELDKNMFGIPKEPYCFSRNFKPKLSAPDFEDCSIKIERDTKITLELID